MLMRSACLLGAMTLALGACTKAANQPADKAAGAQVLPGSISDSMLDLDRSRAQPLLQPPPRADKAVAASASDQASDAAPDQPARPEPAATAT